MPSRAPPLRPPPSPELAALRGPLLACPDCGSLSVRPPHGDEGGVPGSADLMDQRLCPRCGFIGLPVELADGVEYEAFLRELGAG